MFYCLSMCLNSERKEQFAVIYCISFYVILVAALDIWKFFLKLNDYWLIDCYWEGSDSWANNLVHVAWLSSGALEVRRLRLWIPTMAKCHSGNTYSWPRGWSNLALSHEYNPCHAIKSLNSEAYRADLLRPHSSHRTSTHPSRYSG